MINNIDERTGKPKIILHLCAKIGSDSLPYRQAGYDVRIIGEEIGVENYNPPPYVYGIIANPPCTMFSRARSTPKTPRDLIEGMRLVEECQRIIYQCLYSVNGINHPVCPLKFWVIENPGSGYLKWFLGNPTFVYQPYEFGENYSKNTALWGLFNLPIKPLLYNPIKKRRSLCTDLLGAHRTDAEKQARSICPYSFAKAFFEANQ